MAIPSAIPLLQQTDGKCSLRENCVLIYFNIPREGSVPLKLQLRILYTLNSTAYRSGRNIRQKLSSARLPRNGQKCCTNESMYNRRVTLTIHMNVL